MKKLFLTILLIAGFLFINVDNSYACVASQDPMIVGVTANYNINVYCQGSTCNSPAFYAGYPALYTVNSTSFDSVPFSGSRSYLFNGTGVSVGQDILGVAIFEDGNWSQCAAGYFQIIPPPVTPGPVYTANATVISSTSGLLGSMVSGYLGIIPVALSIIGGLMVTLFLVGKLIEWVRSNMGDFGGGMGGVPSNEIRSDDDAPRRSEKGFSRAEDFFSQMHTSLGISGHDDSSDEIMATYKKYGKQYSRKNTGEWVKK
jgi:hypothetical protein